MEKINLCFITDDGYAMQTNVAMTSIYHNRNKDREYDVYILCNNVSKNNKNKFLKYNIDNFKINIVNLDDSGKYLNLDIDDVPASPAAIYKFSIPNILIDIDKVLYLDGDIIVNNDLGEIYDNNIGDNYVGAVKDTSGLSKTLYRLFVNKNVFYFNSGVMLMNLKKMRKDNVTESLINYRINGYNELMDQDSLNYIFRDKVTEFPFKYNTQLMFYYINNSFKKLNKYYMFDSKILSISDIFNNALIVHFSGKKKPWKHYDGMMHDDWLYYYYKSSYKNTKILRTTYQTEKNQGVISFIKKQQKNIRRYKFMKNFINK